MAFRKFHEPPGKMTQLCRKIVSVNVRWRLIERVAVFRRYIRLIWDGILGCSAYNTDARYRKLFPSHRRRSASPPSSTETVGSDATPSSIGYRSDSDLVSLKIGALGDCGIGKTSFLLKYVGDEEGLLMKGVNVMGKSVCVEGATIAFRIWDVGGDSRSFDQLPLACKDAVAILFMFDLTSRSTLNSIIGWYSEARKWNQNAIPVLVGTKFDDFVQLPHEIQWSVITQARTYTRAMKATLFFSSATHNINVNKIFKFVLAKLFNLPWTVHKNLTIGEPIIDF